MKMICFLCLLCLMGCHQEAAGTDSTSGLTGTGESETEMTETDTVIGSIMRDDLLECIDMLGRTVSEIGIPEAAVSIERKYYPQTEISGNLFGVKGDATLYFHDARDRGDDYLARRLWITTRHLNFDECRKRLCETYGNPAAEGEIPYARVNHGAVKWADYRFQNVCLRLSSASETNYILIEIEKSAD